MIGIILIVCAIWLFREAAHFEIKQDYNHALKTNLDKSLQIEELENKCSDYEYQIDFTKKLRKMGIER